MEKIEILSVVMDSIECVTLIVCATIFCCLLMKVIFKATHDKKMNDLEDKRTKERNERQNNLRLNKEEKERDYEKYKINQLKWLYDKSEDKEKEQIKKNILFILGIK